LRVTQLAIVDPMEFILLGVGGEQTVYNAYLKTRVLSIPPANPQLFEMLPSPIDVILG
jgi:hypothetical protein